ncbi:MAG: hypothetical protein ACYCWW_16780 [Deltaproteobacteria bacterium]
MTHPCLAGLAALALTLSCQKGSERAPLVVPLGAPLAAAGTTFAPPADWRKEPDRPMRVATLKPQVAPGDADEGELGIFYFGKGEGGSVTANTDRWLGQFRKADGQAKVRFDRETDLVVDGVKIREVDAAGTFLWTPGPMATDVTPKPRWRLLGAIAEAPGGLVFFKLTGPEATVTRALPGFEAMLRSVRKQ